MSARRSKVIRMAARNVLRAAEAKDTRGVDMFTDILISARATESEVRRAVNVFARKDKHVNTMAASEASTVAVDTEPKATND